MLFRSIMKVVINNCHGGFGLSDDAVVRYHEILGKEVWITGDDYFPTYSLVPPNERQDVGLKYGSPANWHEMSMEEKANWNETYNKQTFYARDLERNDPLLIQVVEELRKGADGDHAELKIVEIPDDLNGNWYVAEYDGLEHIAERHRTWS